MFVPFLVLSFALLFLHKIERMGIFPFERESRIRVSFHKIKPLKLKWGHFFPSVRFAVWGNL
jgi:hypothetical protein